MELWPAWPGTQGSIEEAPTHPSAPAATPIGRSAIPAPLPDRSKPRSPKSAAQRFSQAARTVGLPANRTAHGTHKDCGSFFCENDARNQQIKAWSGLEIRAKADHCAKPADLNRIISGTMAPTPV